MSNPNGYRWTIDIYDADEVLVESKPVRGPVFSNEYKNIVHCVDGQKALWYQMNTLAINGYRMYYRNGTSSYCRQNKRVWR